MGMFDEAIKRHGSATAAVINEKFEAWPIGAAMELLARMAREIAQEEMKRRAGS